MSEVTAPPAVQARLLELQELDTALDQARAAVRRLKADPEHARLRARAAPPRAWQMDATGALAPLPAGED